MTPNSAFRDQRLSNTLEIFLLFFKVPVFKFNSIIQLVTFNTDFEFSPLYFNVEGFFFYI